MLKDLIEKIKNPGPEFRGAPFWAWNSRLDEGELHRQTAIFKEMGFGGFFMHARVGLDTEFLSEEWFRLVGGCVKDAERNGMIAYLYDEDRWPSGTAGGLVTRDRKYRIRMIVMSDSPLDAPDCGFLASFAVDEGAEHPSDWHRTHGETSGRMLYFYSCSSSPESWYNGGTYLDTLNPEAVDHFIAAAYEGYSAKFQERFGRSIGAIFTDEPNYRSASFSENAKTIRVGNAVKSADPPKILPWTDRLPELFRRKYGYDIMDGLPELFYLRHGMEFSKLRRDYFDLLTEMFVDSYIRRLGAWCDEHHLPLTGHLHWEDTLTYQRHQIGAAMRSYEYMQRPGIDQLTEHFQIFDTAKQCVSVARQLDRRWRLTECYGCTGWDFPLAGHKALGEWQYALGINFRCPHLAWYSMAGEAKRDYPASIFFQSPWYRKYPAVEDHFARLGAALSGGEEVRRILVLHPIESTWGWKPDIMLSPDEAWKENQKLIDLRNALLGANLDFDYGDEEIMSRRGSVSGGEITVGSASYSAVVIPELRTIRGTSLDLLEKFRAAGGSVLYIGSPPGRVDAEVSPRAAEVFSGFTPVSIGTLPGALEPFREVSVSAGGAEADPVLTLIRRGADFQVLFLCNLGHGMGEFHQEREPGVLERTAEFPELRVALRSDGAGEVAELDLDSGKFYPVPSVFRDGKRIFTTSLPQIGSRLFLETSGAVPLSAPPAIPENREFMKLSGDWEFLPLGPNVLVLDQAEYAIGAEDLRPREFFIAIDNAVRDHLGVPRRGGAMAQPYTVKDRTPGRSAALTMRFTFTVENIPENLLLAAERPDLCSFMLNGESLAPRISGSWTDPAIKTFPLPRPLLRRGENTLILRTEYDEFHPGVESLFLLGRFGVDGNDAITAMPERGASGDLCRRGFPYYADNFTCERVFRMETLPDKPLFLKFGRWRGSLLGVSVNGSTEKLLPWPPYTMEVTGMLKPGENTLSVTVYGHRRNAFGPFYLNEASPYWNGPLQFKTRQQPEKQLVPFGLLDDPVLTF